MNGFLAACRENADYCGSWKMTEVAEEMQMCTGVKAEEIPEKDKIDWVVSHIFADTPSMDGDAIDTLVDALAMPQISRITIDVDGNIVEFYKG